MAEPNGVKMPGEKPQYQFNGLNSNNSSRGASPIPRAGHIPASQLPPTRGSIPAAQLPPTRNTNSGIIQKVSQLSVSGQSTPNISPNKFSTSTPIQGEHATPVFSENSSPVVPNSMESVPLIDNASSDIVNKNVTLKPSNINSFDSANPNQNQKNTSSTSQYFSQDSSFDTHLNGPQKQITVTENDIPQQPQGNNQQMPFSQANPKHLVQSSQTRSNLGQSMPQNYFQQQNLSYVPHYQSSQGHNTPQNQNMSQNYLQQQNPRQFSPNQHFPQSNVSKSQQNLSSVGRSTPQNLQTNSNLNQYPPVQSNLPPSSSVTHPQVPRPVSQPQFSTGSGENIGPQKINQLGNSGGVTQNPPPYAAYPPHVSLGQTLNKPNLPPVASFPQNAPSFPTQSQIRPQQTQPLSFGQTQRPRYPQTLPQNGPSNQNVAQGFPVRPQFNTGLPPKTTPQHQGTASQPNVSSLTQQTAASLPSQNSQFNYNAAPAVNPGTLQPRPSSQPTYGAPSNSNGPSTLTPLSQTQTRSGISSNRYPAAPQQQQLGTQTQVFPNQQSQYPSGGVVPSGFNRLWGRESHDLLQLPNILPPTKIQAPGIHLGQEALDQANCSSEVFRCTMTKIPETSSLLQKTRLPLGLLIHPFKDLSYLPVIQCNVIVRCRACRTYINPFVYFVDSKRWKCNLCFRVNELPEEFQYDPVSKTYGDPSRRPEIKSSTIEYIAPAEYMLRPPQPAVYLYLLDVSRLAVESGYLEVFCGTLIEELKNIPGDARTQIGFLAFDSALHFFSLADDLNQPHEMTVLDIEDVFLPTPDNLLVNLKDRMEMVEDLLNLLPKRFCNNFDGNSALGAALQVAHKMMGATGGRVTVFQAALPNIGPGAVTAREDPNQRSTAETPLLNPINDFYKRLALECSGQQIAVDLFIVNSQYVDIATISGISRFSGGSIHHFPLFKTTRPHLVDNFQRSLRRYLTRKIGFEAVMRVRCTRGLAIHTFHGNFFVRSTDLLSLPNINPEAAFGMQVAIEENLSDSQSVCFQAALLYTSSKGERRIRVHTLCVPIASTMHDIIQSADQQCIIGLLGKMAVDRSMQSSLSDAREAFINAAIDIISAYKTSLNLASNTSGLLVPDCLKLLPLYISAILKHPAFRIGVPTRLDDRVKAMIDLKTKPLYLLMQQVYPDMYPIHNLENVEVVLNSEEEPVPLPPRLQLSARCLENKGAFLLDCGDQMIILVGPNISREFLNDALGVSDYAALPDDMIEIPILENMTNQRLHQFINYLNDEKPYPVSLQVIRDNSPNRVVFLEKLIEDRLENSLSYHEFLQHLKTQVK